MFVRGTIALVHENGRICYDGALTNSDGSDEAAARADEELMQAELAVEQAEMDVENGIKGMIVLSDHHYHSRT
jgi:hypothetical protein